MSRYDVLIPSYAEQKARGLKPKGRCPDCGRELALRTDQTVSAHNWGDRQGRPGKEVCTDVPVRSANLAIDRIYVDFSTVEARFAVRSIKFMLNQSVEIDSDQRRILNDVVEKLEDPYNMRRLSRTEEWQVLGAHQEEKSA